MICRQCQHHHQDVLLTGYFVYAIPEEVHMGKPVCRLVDLSFIGYRAARMRVESGVLASFMLLQFQRSLGDAHH